MKRFIPVFLIILLCSGCAKRDVNGDLDGFWQLRTITYTANDSTANVRDSLRFMAVQLQLLELRNNNKYGRYARFRHEGDSLFIEMIDSTQRGMQLWMLNFGMNSIRPRFFVRTLNSKHLVLQSDYSIIGFHKF